jgi:hypothetical protein
MARHAVRSILPFVPLAVLVAYLICCITVPWAIERVVIWRGPEEDDPDLEGMS